MKNTTKLYDHTKFKGEKMECPKRFVITNTPNLLSPAGHHPEERIFVKTEVAIHCDEMPAKLPKCNGNLYAHDVDKISGKVEA